MKQQEGTDKKVQWGKRNKERGEGRNREETTKTKQLPKPHSFFKPI